MIVVTGATGQLGRAIVTRLLDRLPADQLGVSVRDPGKATDLSERGVRVRRGDFTESATLDDAFEGASQVLIVSGPADPAPHRQAIDAAKAAGAGRILYTSHMGANPDSLFTATRAHAETEQDLQASGVPFTSLRDGFHTSSALWMLSHGLRTGEVRLPADGPVSWTAHADLAAAAVTALTEPDRLKGITPPLTGPEALDFDALTAIASDLTGRRITRTVITDEQYVADLVAAGTPKEYTGMALSIFTASRRGEFATVDPTLGDILGHRPTSARDVLATTLTRQDTAPV